MQFDSQVTLYPTPAPAMQEELISFPVLVEIEKTCEYLYAPHGTLSNEQREKILQHFQQLFQFMDSSYHVELLIAAEGFDWSDFWQAIHQFFPQFAWTKIQTEPPKYGRQTYRVDFIPLVYQETGFPFAVRLEESLSQQFPLLESDPVKHVEQLIKDLGEQHIKKTTNENSEVVNQTETQAVETMFNPVQEENVRQESQSKARLRAVNQKLEMVIEKLELSMLHSGIQYFDQDYTKEESDWDKRLTISLREYTYLLQKARFLEQMWNLNGEMINKTEKMTVTGNKLVYERDQVKQIKANLSTRDIHFVLYECQVIESRAKVHTRPWFRKPYVKLMKMDYDNLLGKAAYFDLLQGESSILEKYVREHKEISPNFAQEVG
ncbi:hypothetical protein [Enterococcus sp. AZ072]|uniref:hypothetical protein n=1 Tax=unclassified Enterococcus TaxID=2608891 RepID=UPI003D282275